MSELHDRARRVTASPGLPEWVALMVGLHRSSVPDNALSRALGLGYLQRLYEVLDEAFAIKHECLLQ